MKIEAAAFDRKHHCHADLRDGCGKVTLIADSLADAVFLRDVYLGVLRMWETREPFVKSLTAVAKEQAREAKAAARKAAVPA